MKVVIKNDTVVAIHRDNQSITDAYLNCDILEVANDFKYATPIVEDKTERTYIKVGDPSSNLIVDLADDWAIVRTTRDRLLAETDREVVSDKWESMSIDHKKAWAEYRQMLRDVPGVNTDPTDVQWPSKPILN